MARSSLLVKTAIFT